MMWPGLEKVIKKLFKSMIILLPNRHNDVPYQIRKLKADTSLCLFADDIYVHKHSQNRQKKKKKKNTHIHLPIITTFCSLQSTNTSVFMHLRKNNITCFICLENYLIAKYNRLTISSSIVRGYAKIASSKASKVCSLSVI